MFVENPGLIIGGEQDCSAVTELCFIGGELNRVSADYCVIRCKLDVCGGKSTL